MGQSATHSHLSAQSDVITTRLPWALLALRVTVFIVMFVWTLDKFVNPAHGMAIFEKFYGIGGVPEMAVYIMGLFQLALVFAFSFLFSDVLCRERGKKRKQLSAFTSRILCPHSPLPSSFPSFRERFKYELI